MLVVLREIVPKLPDEEKYDFGKEPGDIIVKCRKDANSILENKQMAKTIGKILERQPLHD